MRRAKGLNLFTYDARLESAASEHATALANGKARPHDQLQQRIQKYNFPTYFDRCLISRRGIQANYSEGIVDVPPSLDIFKSLDFLTSSNPGEAHYDDFFDKVITHIGIGIGESAHMNYIVLDYGRLCDKEPDKVLTEEDFDMIVR
jgi:hypothetical protein